MSKTDLVTNEKLEVRITAGDNTAYVNDKPIELKCSPFISNRRLFAPLKFISEVFGIDMEYDASVGTININEYIHNIYMSDEDSVIPDLVTLKQITMDAMPIETGNGTFIPIRFILEMLGLNVTWDQPTLTATVRNFK